MKPLKKSLFGYNQPQVDILINEMNHEIDILRKSLADVQDESNSFGQLQNANKTIDELKKEIDSLNYKLLENRSLSTKQPIPIDSLRQSSKINLNNQEQDNNETITLLNDNIKKLENSVKYKDKQIAGLQNRVKYTEEQLDSLKKALVLKGQSETWKVASLQENTEKSLPTNETLDKYKKAVEQKQKQIKNLESALSVKEAACDALMAQKSQLEDKLREMNTIIARLKQEVVRLQKTQQEYKTITQKSIPDMKLIEKNHSSAFCWARDVAQSTKEGIINQINIMYDDILKSIIVEADSIEELYAIRKEMKKSSDEISQQFNNFEKNLAEKPSQCNINIDDYVNHLEKQKMLLIEKLDKLSDEYEEGLKATMENSNGKTTIRDRDKNNSTNIFAKVSKPEEIRFDTISKKDYLDTSQNKIAKKDDTEKEDIIKRIIEKYEND